MGIKSKCITANLKGEATKRVTLVDNECLGTGTFTGDTRANARTIGIPGPQGEQGPQGEPGIPGEQGPAGLVGLNWLGEYDPGATYQQRDGVSYGGKSYIYTFGVPVSGVDPTNPTHWDILAESGSDGDKTYLHNQTVAATQWVINHSLGKFPSVTVVDSAGTQVEGEVIYNNINTVTLNFSSAFGGKAYLN